MATNQCVCCKEIEPIKNKIDALNDSVINCITEHPGFNSVCLNVWVLQAAYFRQEYGLSLSPNIA